MTSPDADSSMIVEDPKEATFGDPDYLLFLLVQICRYRDAEFDEALAPLGLSNARYRALNAIVAAGSCLMGELAELVGVDRTTMTRTVDQLVAAELVERHTPVNDRRQVMLAPTEDGRRVFAAAWPIVRRINRRVLDGVTGSAQRIIIQAEQRMFINLAVEPRIIDRTLAFRRPLAGPGKSAK